jgi:hypothetical protein
MTNYQTIKTNFELDFKTKLIDGTNLSIETFENKKLENINLYIFIFQEKLSEKIKNSSIESIKELKKINSIKSKIMIKDFKSRIEEIGNYKCNKNTFIIFSKGEQYIFDEYNRVEIQKRIFSKDNSCVICLEDNKQMVICDHCKIYLCSECYERLANEQLLRSIDKIESKRDQVIDRFNNNEEGMNAIRARKICKNKKIKEFKNFNFSCPCCRKNFINKKLFDSIVKR